MFEKIMVPSDGSQHAKRAEDVALALARELGSTVVAVHIIDDKFITPFEVLEMEGKDILKSVTKKGKELGVQVDEILIFGNPIHDMAKISLKAEADLVVIGTHGRTRLEKLIMGSVAESALKIVPVPVMLVK